MYKIILSLIIASLTFISCDQEVSVSPTDVNISTGFMFVDSYPHGFSIYLNGRIEGKLTPDSLKWLDEGNYEVTLKQPLFRDTSFFVDIVEGEVNNFFIDYTNNPMMRGYIDCITNPENAQVYINDSLIENTTPCRISNLWPGYYDIKYNFDGYRDADISVTVMSNEFSPASVTMVDTAVWNDFTSNNSAIISDDLTCVVVDADNIVWVGTKKDGLNSFDGNSWTHYDMTNAGIPNDSITCLAAENNGTLWVGTRGGFTSYNNSVWYNYGMGAIEDIEIDDQGIKWIGSYGGLIVLTEGGMSLYNAANSGLPDNRVTEVVIDRNGDKWLGTYGYGIIKFSNNTWTAYTRALSGIPGDRISTGAEDQEGNLWFGHFPWAQEVGGLSFYSNSTWERMLSLPSQLIEWIHVDNDNNKWIGTAAGLLRITPSGIRNTYVYDNTGLNLSHVKCISEDINGNLWIATHGGGLVKLNMNNLP